MTIEHPVAEATGVLGGYASAELLKRPVEAEA